MQVTPGNSKQRFTDGMSAAMGPSECLWPRFLLPMDPQTPGSLPTTPDGLQAMYSAVYGTSTSASSGTTSASSAGPAPAAPLVQFHHRFALPVPPLARGPNVEVVVAEKAFLTGWQTPCASARLDLAGVVRAPNTVAAAWEPLALGPLQPLQSTRPARSTASVLIAKRYIPHLEAKLRVTVSHATLGKKAKEV